MSSAQLNMAIDEGVTFIMELLEEMSITLQAEVIDTIINRALANTVSVAETVRRNSVKINTEIVSKTCSLMSEECPICMESYKVRQKVMHLNCNHHFHSRCMKKWLKNSNHQNCPICRSHI